MQVYNDLNFRGATMLQLNQINTPGDHLLTLEGVIGPLEACFTMPEQMNTNYIAVLGHPIDRQATVSRWQ